MPYIKQQPKPKKAATKQSVPLRRRAKQRPMAMLSKKSVTTSTKRSVAGNHALIDLTRFDFESSFPTGKEMNDPDTWDAVFEYVKLAALKRDAATHASLRTEMKCVYGLASHFVSHHGDYAKFREMRSIKSQSTDVPKILSEVLFEYTGRKPDQKKKASKYKRQLLPSLMDRLSVSAFDKKIEKVGGVFNLIAPPLPKKSDQPEEPEDDFEEHVELDQAIDECIEQKAKILIVRRERIEFRLKKGSIQTLDFINCDEEITDYVVTIRRYESDKTEELLLLSDEDTEISTLDY